MIVIRRMVDRRHAYTAIFLKGEPPKIFPTSDAEHARILQVYKQDRPHEGILNDFVETDFPRPTASSATPAPHAPPAPWPLTASPAQPSKKKSGATPTAKKSVASARSKKSAPRSQAPTAPPPLWLALVDPPATPSRR